MRPVEEDWVAPGATSLRGRYRLADHGTAIQAKLRAGWTVVVPDILIDPSMEKAGAALAVCRCLGVINGKGVTVLGATLEGQPQTQAPARVPALKLGAYVRFVVAEARDDPAVARLATAVTRGVSAAC